MSEKEEEGQEPPPNATAGPAGAGYHRGFPRRSEVKSEEEFAVDGGARNFRGNRGSLRRRYRRRSQPNEGEERKPSECPPGDGAASRGHGGKREPEEGDAAPVRPPRWSGASFSAPSTTDDAARRAAADGGPPGARSPPPRSPLPVVHLPEHIRQPDERLRDKFRNRLRSAADVPEVHFVGEVTEGVGFKDTYVSCKW